MSRLTPVGTRMGMVLILSLLAGLRPWPSPAAAEVMPSTGLPPATAAASPLLSTDLPPAARALARLTEVMGEPPFQTTRIFDRHGNLLYEIADRGRRTVVSLDRFPAKLVQATIATEDKAFYLHEGVDPVAIGRAMLQNLMAGDIVAGGSTIPQQLARILLMDETERYQQSFLRKVREASLAFRLSQRYSKDQILEMYLNSVYYGNQAYGAAAAAQTYFNKDVSELTLAECAFLAGLPQAPNYLDPFVNFERAKQRQRIVLELMRRQGYITEQQKARALAAPINLIRLAPIGMREAPHFVDYVRDLLQERYGTEGIRQGLEVHTSIDLRYQKLATEIARAHVAAVGPGNNISNAAVVIIQPQTGEVLAMVGSVDYYNVAISGQVNMAVRPRQPGSAIKPVLYATAFDHGYSPATVTWDAPVSYPLGNGRLYTPRNFTGQFYGGLRLRAALANSLNVPTIKLLHALGVETMLEGARRLGITAWRAPASEYGLSLAVGGYEVPLIELTHAYAILANQGAYVPLAPVTLVRDSAGRVLFQAAPPDPPIQAVSRAAAYQVASILSDARTRQMVFGRNSPLNTSQPTAVKTGTTDSWRDNLTIGFTSYVTVGVWLGNTDARPMRDSLGARTAGPVWHDIMEAIWADPSLHDSLGFAGQPLPQGFTPPPTVFTAPICDLLPGNFNRDCPVAYEEVFAIPEPAGATTPQPPIGEEIDRRLGYCLPALQADLPRAAREGGVFVALPDDPTNAAAARRWAERFGLPLRHADECDLTPVARPLAPTPALPQPTRLVKLPAPTATEPPAASTAAPAASADATTAAATTTTSAEAALPTSIQVGGYAEVYGSVSALNIRKGPGTSYAVLGTARRGQVLEVKGGPRQVNGGVWYEVHNPATGVTGWSSGLYLRPANPPAAAAPQTTVPTP